jgi:acyl dehydratase
MMRLARPVELTALVGQEIGVSSWQLMSQQRVDAFADATGDHQWIHVDPGRAAAGPFGVPLAHGFLGLALVPMMIFEVVEVGGVDLILNKGVGKSRFTTPVRVGDRVRGRITLVSARIRPRDYWECVFAADVEIDGRSDPALHTEITFLYQAERTAADDVDGRLAASA